MRYEASLSQLLKSSISCIVEQGGKKSLMYHLLRVGKKEKLGNGTTGNLTQFGVELDSNIWHLLMGYRSSQTRKKLTFLRNGLSDLKLDFF